jgi:hypothetical protein
MNRFARGATLFAFLLAGTAALAADPPAEPTYQAPWYTRWFGIGPEPPKPAPKPKRDPAQEASAQLAAARASLLRRQEVIDALREIAVENGDQALLDRADQLEIRALEVYKQQTARLPFSKMLPSADECSLDRQLDLGPDTSASAAHKLDKSSTPDVGRTGQASAIREVKP